jgi:hypothetical protein
VGCMGQAHRGRCFLFEALLVIVLLQFAVDAHPGDTLLPVAAGHLQAFFIVFALLRRLDRASTRPPGTHDWAARCPWPGFTDGATRRHPMRKALS